MTVKVEKVEKIEESQCEICFRGGNVFYFRVGNRFDTPIINIHICEECYKELVYKMAKGE